MVNNRRQFIKAAGLTLLAHQGMYIANAFAAPKKKFFQNIVSTVVFTSGTF
jgi:hypothetical protein